MSVYAKGRERVICKGGYMAEKIRVHTLKHVIILIFSIVVALAISLHFSEEIFAAELLPAAAVEENEEDLQREEALPEADAVGLEEASEKADSALYAASHGDAVDVNTASEEVPVIAGDEKSEDADADEEAVKTNAPADAADDAKQSGSAVEAADAEKSDSAAETADTEKSADAVPADSAAKSADAEKTADGEKPDSTAGVTDAEKAAASATAGGADKAADAENATAEATEDSAAKLAYADNIPVTAADSASKAADAERTAGAEKSESTVEGADSEKSAATDAAAADESNGGNAADSLVKAGASVDPLIYLLECLKYHGNETNPEAFSLRAYTEDGQSVVTPVKNQAPWSTCWGFAAIAASETSILSECYAKWDQLAPGMYEKYGISTFEELCEWLDLSEKQIAWFSFVPEPENGNYPSQAGEGLIGTKYGMGGIYDATGGIYYATSVFSRGTGPLEESRVPYQNNEGVLDAGRTVKAKDGTEYVDQDYADNIIEKRDVQLECMIPYDMSKEEVLTYFEGDTKEVVRKRIEEGRITVSRDEYRYVDDNGNYYHVVRRNQIRSVKEGYPEIVAFVDDNNTVYEFNERSLSFPGLPLIRPAYYDWSVDETLRYASMLSLEGTNVLPKYKEEGTVKESTIKAIKDELTAGRAVSISFCADTSAPGQQSEAKYINQKDNIWAHYTYMDGEGGNHSVTIVGYNDKFPRTLFLEGHEPPKDGAWLVRNSWGGGLSTGTNFGNWGIDENGDGIGDGYFWLSYWDKSIIAPETFDYRVEDLVTDRMEYDVRQYDFMTTAEPIKYNCEKEANVFTAEMTTNVREIGVQNYSDDTTISYEIYLLNENAANPTDGVLLASGSEYFKYGGYHRIKTDKVCIIPAGLKYSVVVTKMKQGRPYVSVFYDFSEQYWKDQVAQGNDGVKKYSNAVVNKGESYILDRGKWTDWADYIPEFRNVYTSVYTRTKEEWLAVDNFSIKAYADYISQDLIAEATKIGYGVPESTVGVVDESAAKKDALVPLALVHNEISNNADASKASAVAKGYISAEDYTDIVNALTDPNLETGLKVVVDTKEIDDDDMSRQERNKLLKAADQKIACYAEVSLLVYALETGDYLGSLHKTDDPIDLAITIPYNVFILDAPMYVLRLHDGVVERLATTVRDGHAYFASDKFSLFALAYDVAEAGGDDSLDEQDTAPENEDPGIAPVNSENKEPAKCGVTKTSVKKSEVKKAKAAEGRVIAAETGDVSNVTLWLALMILAVGAALTVVFAKTKKE